MKGGSSNSRGFTLIELMLVVAIIGLLAAIAIPKFANLVVKAKEASVKGKLGALRSALSIYYADNESYIPLGYQSFPTALTGGGKYIDSIPVIQIPTANQSHQGNDLGHQATPADVEFWAYGGAWHYSGFSGRISVNCTHTDSNGTTWSLW
jgi:type IV pilus assembly protein PilA